MAVSNEVISVIFAILATPSARLSCLALAFLKCVVFSDELTIGAENRPRLGKWIGPKYCRYHQKDQDSETYEKPFHAEIQ